MDPNIQAIQHDGIFFIFNRDSVNTYNASGGLVVYQYGWQNLGTIEERTDKVNTFSETIYDDSSGKRRPIAKILNGFEQIYEFTTPNVAQAVLEIYLQSLPAIAPSPALAAGTVTSAPITLDPGQPAKIFDATGKVSALNVASVTSITVNSTPLVAGVDWGATKQQLAGGFITILPTSTVVTTRRTTGTITYVAGGVTGLVQLNPASGPCCIQGVGQVHFVSCGQIQRVDEGYFALEIAEATRDPSKATRFKVTATRLFDPSGVYEDRFVTYKG